MWDCVEAPRQAGPCRSTQSPGAAFTTAWLQWHKGVWLPVCSLLKPSIWNPLVSPDHTALPEVFKGGHLKATCCICGWREVPWLLENAKHVPKKIRLCCLDRSRGLLTLEELCLFLQLACSKQVSCGGAVLHLGAPPSGKSLALRGKVVCMVPF